MPGLPSPLSTGNVYAGPSGGPMGGPYEMEDDDYVNYPLGRSRYSQVVSAQSHAFWKDNSFL